MVNVKICMPISTDSMRNIKPLKPTASFVGTQCYLPDKYNIIKSLSKKGNMHICKTF